MQTAMDFCVKRPASPNVILRLCCAAKTIGITLAFYLTSTTSAYAIDPIKIFQNWALFAAKKDGQLSCYIASTPVSKQGNYSKRGAPYVLVSYKSRTVDEFSYSPGYEFDPKAANHLALNGQTFKAHTRGETGWMPNTEADAALINIMRQATTMEAVGNSKRGTHSVDTYSLNGFAAAYTQMKEQCK